MLVRRVLIVSVLLLCLSSGAAPTMRYYGGKVVSNPKVVQVLWGTGFSADVQTNLGGFYTAVLNSPYLDWLSEYATVGLNGYVDGLPGSNQRIGRGSFVGTFAITPSTTAKTLSNDQVRTEIAAQITAGKLPAPTTDWQGDVNTIYMVDFPSGYTITAFGSTSCVQFCAIFDTLTLNAKSVGIGLLPDITSGGCAGGCGASAVNLQNITSVHSHELLNIITSLELPLTVTSVARPIGWYSNGASADNGTVGTVCNAQTATVSNYTVQKGWSEKARTCIASAAIPLPVCDGSTAYCRECNAADNGASGGCTGTKAVCETDESNGAFGECVSCATNAQCSGTAPVCSKADAGNDICRACAADSECAGNSAGPHCLASGACGAAPAPDAGTLGGGDGGSGPGGGTSKSGCSTSGSPASVAWAGVLALALLLGSRRARTRALRPGVD